MTQPIQKELVEKIKENLYKDKTYANLLFNGKLDMKFLDYAIIQGIQQGIEIGKQEALAELGKTTLEDLKLLTDKSIKLGRKQLAEEIIKEINELKISQFGMWISKRQIKEKLQKEIQ